MCVCVSVVATACHGWLMTLFCLLAPQLNFCTFIAAVIVGAIKSVVRRGVWGMPHLSVQ